MVQQSRNVGNILRRSLFLLNSFERLSDRNNTFQEFSANDETRGNIPDNVSEFSVPGTHFFQQSITHHIKLGSFCDYGFFKCLIQLRQNGRKMNFTEKQVCSVFWKKTGII